MALARSSPPTLGTALAAAGCLLAAAEVPAQVVAPSYEADPDVSKRASGHDPFREILGTWKPGQRDGWHSPAGRLASYALTDCSSRVHRPDGRVSKVRHRTAGEAGFTPVTASHALEIEGSTECRMLRVERK